MQQELDDTELDEQSELYEHHRFECDKSQSLLRVDKYLFMVMANTSRNRVQKAADAGRRSAIHGLRLRL